MPRSVRRTIVGCAFEFADRFIGSYASRGTLYGDWMSRAPCSKPVKIDASTELVCRLPGRAVSMAVISASAN